MKKISGYMIAVPDKNNPQKVNHFYVTGPRFLYKDKIIKEYYDDGTEKVVKEVKNKSKNENNSTPKIADESNKIGQENEIRLQIASEVKRILNEKKNEEPNKKNNSVKMRSKKKISKPKEDDECFKNRYTAPKERGIIARIINQMKYENGWYEDVEDYLYDEDNFIWDDLEWSKNAEKRRDQILYKRVQAYEDAEDDITMKKSFLAVKVTAAAALIAALGFSANYLYNEVHDLIHNSSYVAQAQEKSTLANANPGQIEHAERVIAQIDYNFEHLSHSELLDTVIRVGSKPSQITANRAMSTMKNASEFADQKLLQEIIEEVYVDEYVGFGDEKKQELNQLIYEMLDDDVRMWIRSPEDVAKLQTKNNTSILENDEVESER